MLVLVREAKAENAMKWLELKERLEKMGVIDDTDITSITVDRLTDKVSVQCLGWIKHIESEKEEANK